MGDLVRPDIQLGIGEPLILINKSGRCGNAGGLQLEESMDALGESGPPSVRFGGRKLRTRPYCAGASHGSRTVRSTILFPGGAGLCGQSVVVVKLPTGLGIIVV